MAIPAGTEIVARSGLILDLDEGVLKVKFLLSDGSTAATWWSVSDLERYCGVVSPSQRTPAGASIQ